MIDRCESGPTDAGLPRNDVGFVFTVVATPATAVLVHAGAADFIAATSGDVRVAPGGLLVHAGVPVCLDGAVGAAVQELGNVGPPVSQAKLSVVDDLLLLVRPRFLLQRRFQGVLPTA